MYLAHRPLHFPWLVPVLSARHLQSSVKSWNKVGVIIGHRLFGIVMLMVLLDYSSKHVF